MSQCKAYEQKDIEPDIYNGAIPVNCCNCIRWTGKRCGDENVAVNMNDPDLVESIGFCQW